MCATAWKYNVRKVWRSRSLLWNINRNMKVQSLSEHILFMYVLCISLFVKISIDFCDAYSRENRNDLKRTTDFSFRSSSTWQSAKKEAADSSKNLVHNYLSTRRHIPEEQNLNLHRPRNLKSRTWLDFLSSSWDLRGTKSQRRNLANRLEKQDRRRVSELRCVHSASLNTHVFHFLSWPHPHTRCENICFI